jgi:hypothetical protein
MAILELRRRGSTFLFVVVVVAHIVLISAQVTSKSGVPLLQAVTFGLVAQVQRAGYAFASSARRASACSRSGRWHSAAKS